MLKRFTQAVFANFRLKLLAIAISLGIWFYANSRLVEDVPVTASLAITPRPATPWSTRATAPPACASRGRAR